MNIYQFNCYNFIICKMNFDFHTEITDTQIQFFQ